MRHRLTEMPRRSVLARPMSRCVILWNMFERFTNRARRALVLAREEARLLNHDFIGAEHLLLGLLHEGEGVAAKALTVSGVRLETARPLT